MDIANIYIVNSIIDNRVMLFVSEKIPGKSNPTNNILSIKKAKIIANIDHPNNR